MRREIVFTPETLAYLARHGKQGDTTITQIARSKKQFQTVRRLLDTHKPRSMLDIGCGLGLSSLMIAKYSNMKYLGLLDGDGSGELFHDYRSEALAWNNVRVAGGLARINLADTDCKVETFVQGHHPVKIPVDLIVSFKSWGTHYPVATYLELAAQSLMNGGLVVLDLRPDDEEFRAGQRAEIEAFGFRLVERSGDRRHVYRKL
jgi:SAM-dependent methyltransferase